MKFNKEQEDIIKSIEGAYLIKAPVGTGKTTVLIERILRALEQGIEADEILALTFTNRAAEEIKTRLREKINDQAHFDSLLVKTFHGFCAHFLKAEAKSLGLNADFLILDEEEQINLAQSIIGEKQNFHLDSNRDLLNIFDRIYRYRLNQLQISWGHKIAPLSLDDSLLDFSNEYLKELNRQGALDFNELVLRTLEGLNDNKNIQEKWSNRFKFIQVDEFQDTHLSEYLVIKELAKKHKNLSFIGDIDQTIYSFRDSRPRFIANLFKEHFAPVKEKSLLINYRSNPNLIKAFLSILEKMEEAETKNLNDSGQEFKADKCLHLFAAYNLEEEVSWIIDRIKKLKKENPQAKIAVLNRANWTIKEVAQIFSKNNISFLTVDQYDFFKRQEVKDLLAYLKILINRSDFLAARRVIDRPAKNIGEETLKKIKELGLKNGLSLADFLSFKNYAFEEPYAPLLKAYKEDRIVVLDTETTGLNPAKDEIVQVYAREIVAGKLGREFHRYLKNTKSVGSAYFVHKISDEFLAEQGEDPKKVLAELKTFLEDACLVGHNLSFDLNMIKENSARQGIEIEFNNYYDTLVLARKLLKLESYKLSHIAQRLNFKTATHSADDDVAATIDLLFYLLKTLEKQSSSRQKTWASFKNKFIKLSSDLENWEKELEQKRPDELLDFIWTESGLRDYYQSDKNWEQREKSFLTLRTFFKVHDQKSLDQRASLHNLIHFSSLLRNIDFLGLEQGQIPIVTIHQVKGLEFDYVFLLALNEGSFPLYKSNDIEEEKRLFYVALTRARQEVFLSYSHFKSGFYRDKSLAKSQLVNLIDKNLIKKY